jgi:hypothetical protein
MNALNIASQIIEARTAPVEQVTGPRAAKVIAANRIRIPSEAAAAAKGRKKRMAVEKREAKAEARAQAKLDREAKRAQKADKVNKRKTKKVKKVKGPSKRTLLKLALIEEIAAIHPIFHEGEILSPSNSTVKELRQLLREVKKANKVKIPKRVKLTDEQKLANKAQRAYDCEMRRRAKWLKDYTAKYDLDSRANPIEEPEFLDDGMVC